MVLGQSWDFELPHFGRYLLELLTPELWDKEDCGDDIEEVNRR